MQPILCLNTGSQHDGINLAGCDTSRTVVQYGVVRLVAAPTEQKRIQSNVVMLLIVMPALNISRVTHVNTETVRQDDLTKAIFLTCDVYVTSLQSFLHESRYVRPLVHDMKTFASN